MITLSFSKAIVEGLEKELTRALELNNLRLYKIVQSLLWVHEGKALKRIARLLRVNIKTVDNWLRRFIVQGFGWLCGQHYQGRGRKSKLSAEQKQTLYELVEKGQPAKAAPIFARLAGEAELRGMERQANPWGISPAERMKWTEGMPVTTIDENPEPETLDAGDIASSSPDLVIDASYVDTNLSELATDNDLSRYIL